MSNEEKIWFEHILDAAEKAVKFSQNKSKEDLKDDDMLYLATLKCIEIIGEASNRVSEQTRNQFQDIQWRDIIAMRNRLVHGYFDVDYTILWNVVVNRLPELIDKIKIILLNADNS
ncbi:MAG: DUF86 domain-containing protein [Bacteroidetes bacterium]|nr:MAG: DUF86 domain-containing protein [Bacteroidota bacterium]